MAEEFHSPSPVVACLIINRGRILLLRRAIPPGSGRWALPAGYVEPGESAEQALVREVREETGLEVEAGYRSSWGRVLDGQRSVLGLCFEAEVVQDRVELDEESSDHRWVAIDRVELEAVDWAFSTHRDAALSLLT
jgi:8-oxo-dGTP diphosphatase